MKRDFLGFLVLPIIICMLLTGCTKENNTEQSGDTDMESIMERYYADFSLLVTQNCLEAMMANREPYKYDERAEKNQERITVKEINFKEYDAAKGVYSFSVLLEGQSGMETKTYLGSYMETEG